MHRSKRFLKGFLKKKRVKSAIFLSVLFLGLTLTLLILKNQERFVPETKYDSIIHDYSEKYGLDVSLVYAVIEAESNFNEKAVSSAGAAGLMQLMPETFEWILPTSTDGEKRDIFSPNQNVEAGCKYLSYLIKRFKITETALAAYNSGEGTVSLWLKNKEYSDDGISLKEIPYSETRLYVSKVIRRAYYYKKALK